MLPLFLLLTTLDLVTAFAPGRRNILDRRQASSFTGVATFVNFGGQGNTVCGPMSGAPGTYGAAAGDLSPDISGGPCDGFIDPSQCNGQVPVDNYATPHCPTGNCGTCYQVTNAGGMNGADASGAGSSIIVQIIDSCPSSNAWNFCKTAVSETERCGAAGVNQLDIDASAYGALTGAGGGANLAVGISPITCP